MGSASSMNSSAFAGAPGDSMTAGQPGTEQSKLPALPNPYDLNDEQTRIRILDRFDRSLQTDSIYRNYFELDWFRNVLYYAGKQWIILDGPKRRWRQKNLPLWFPTPITNKFAEKANDIVSALLQQRPTINYEPATGDSEDVATAEISARVMETAYDEMQVDSFEQEIAAWVAITGNCFLVPYYDDDPKYGTTQVNRKQCLECGLVSKPYAIEDNEGVCLGPDCPGTTHVDAVHPITQKPVLDIYPIGRLRADVVSPFEIRVDPRIRDIRDHHYYTRLSTWNLDKARAKWPDYRDQIQADKEENLGQIYLDALAYLSTSFGGTALLGTGATTNDTRNPRTTIYTYNELSSEEFPEGLRAVRVGKGGPIVEAEPLPFDYGAGRRKGARFLNLVHFGFDIVPGRLWRKTRMDDLISLQSYRNLIEAVLKLTTQRSGNSVWLNPTGSNFDNFSGDPGLVIEYSPVSLGGSTFAKPERLPAELGNIQPLIVLLNKLDDSMERVAGTFFLQGGDVPPGVTAASALAYLGERAERSMSPFKREWAKSWAHLQEMVLEIYRKHAVDERIRVVAGRNKKWQVDKFKKADLTGAINIKVDFNSLSPKSQATQRATIAQLIQLGVINPMDPEQQYKILEVYGETALKGSEDIDIEETIKEWDEFLTSKGQKQPILLPLVQNSLVHITQHGNAAKTDEFKELPPEMQQIWLNHINMHYTDLMARQSAFTPPDPNAETPDGGEGSPSSRATATGPSRPAPIQRGEEAAAREQRDVTPPSGMPTTG